MRHRRSPARDVVACHVYGHPKWEHFERMFDLVERMEPVLATGIARLVIVGTLLGVFPILINLLEWRAL